MSTITTISESVGANRIVPTIAIPYPVGNPSLSKDVEKVMADVKDFIDNTKFAELREEGLACDTTNFDAWSNKVKATCFSAIQKKGLKKQTNTVWSFSAPTETESNVPTDFWSQMKSKYN